MYDLLIIGGGPAALSCAMTARKRGMDCAVIASDDGSGWLAKSDRLDNYPGMPHVSGMELLRVFREQAEELGAKFIHGMARQLQQIPGEWMVLAGNDVLEARAVVLAMGAARPKLLPGEDEMLGTGVSWCGTCDGMFYRGKEVGVISAWHDGVEEAQFLAGLASHVDYYTLAAHDLPQDKRIELVSGRVQELRREADGKRIAIVTDQGSRTYDGVFVFRPTVAPDKLIPGIALDGPFIAVDRRMATSLPLLYACGDCAGKPLQVAKAVGEGNIAAISASEDLAKQA